MEYVIGIVLFTIAIPVVLFVIFKPVMVDKKVRNDIANSDPLTQHYCFVLDHDQAEALDRLAMRNVNDSLEYTLDPNRSIIVFTHLGTSIEYQLSFYVVENKTYMKVSRVKYMHSRSNIPLMINHFFIEKIGAVPVVYSYFESSICTPE